MYKYAWNMHRWQEGVFCGGWWLVGEVVKKRGVIWIRFSHPIPLPRGEGMVLWGVLVGVWRINFTSTQG